MNLKLMKVSAEKLFVDVLLHQLEPMVICLDTFRNLCILYDEIIGWIEPSSRFALLCLPVECCVLTRPIYKFS